MAFPSRVSRSAWNGPSRLTARELASNPAGMPTQDDVRRLALALPDTAEDPDHFGFRVDGKQFAWAWNKRIDPKRARIPQADILVVRVANELEKQSLLSLDPSV